MENMESIFRFRYKEEISKILEELKKQGLYYIEVSPIIPSNSEMFFGKKVEFKNKNYTMATYNIDFNIINKYLDKKTNYYTCVKGIENDEVDLIFIQLYDLKKIENIKKIIKKYKYDIKQEEQYTKIVVEI